MKKMLSVVVLFGAICAICLPGSAFAIPAPVGEPFSIGSWSQGFIETGVGLFDKVETLFISGNSFEPPPFTGFTNAGWSGSLVNPGYALGVGPAVTSLTWNINFYGEKATPLVFDFFAYYQSRLLESARASWTGSAWTFVAVPAGVQYDRTAVPEPATMLLLGLGLVGLAGARRKFKK